MNPRTGIHVRPEPNMLFTLPIIKFLNIWPIINYSPHNTDYSLSKTYYSH